VLWRPAGRGLEVALVHRPRYDDWSFPKGKRARGEHILLTAVREVAEETGVRPVLGRRLPSTAYPTHAGRKHVDYWAAQPGPGHPGPGQPVHEVPNDEVDAVAWLAPDDARQRLSYAHDVALLGSFTAGPAATVPVILLRHAAAVSRQEWAAAGHREDLTRPLSAEGRAQAAALAQILRCFPRAHVISSAAERCLATVRHYAELAGTTVEAEPAFTLEPGSPAGAGNEWAPTPAARKRAAEAVESARPVIICGHRQNMPSLLAWVCERLGAPVPQGPPLDKGSFWVLHASECRLASAERHDTGDGGQSQAGQARLPAAGGGSPSLR
jgi:8-oxo-(d)GTP phosphatase